MSANDPSEATRPALDHAVSVLVGKALNWLGRRAARRGDRHDYGHARAALLAGNCTTECQTFSPGARCTGAGDCPAGLHIHGCYADRDGTACDDPEDHRD